MSRYIDVDKLLDGIECIDISDCTDIDDIFIEIEKEIDEYPTADVTEVVRCKDCKCYELMRSNNKHFCNEFGGYVTENDFCSRGERRNGGNGK